MSKETAAKVFGAAYSGAYDALYEDKDYGAEVDFLESCMARFGIAPAHRVLDLGCGTGSHLIPLAQRGYRAHGVDRSRHMLAAARRKARAAGVADRVSLEQGDIQRFAARRPFDVVICMFAVLGYQAANDALFATLRKVRKSLRPGGIFICDFWYGPAVLADRPRQRVRERADGGERLVRITSPQVHTESNSVDVTFHLMRLRDRHLAAETRETHRMRYFFQPEIAFFFSQAGLELARMCEFPFLERDVCDSSWNAAAIARAV